MNEDRTFSETVRVVENKLTLLGGLLMGLDSGVGELTSWSIRAGSTEGGAS